VVWGEKVREGVMWCEERKVWCGVRRCGVVFGEKVREGEERWGREDK
jgi:hypothetical protein